MRRVLVLALTCFSAAAAQDSGLSPEVLFLSRMVRHVAASVTVVPNYTCTETLYREQLPAHEKAFRPIDLVKFEVAKVGHKEVFAWPGAGKFEEKTISDFLGAGGLVGDGIFNLFATDLFVHRSGRLIYRGTEYFNGHKAIRIDYVVGSLRASFSLRTEMGTAVVSYSGSFWVDPESMDLFRLIVNADDIPAYMQLSAVTITIDFRADNALPESAVLEMRKTSGAISRDQVRFIDCRKFAGDATIVFDPSDSPVIAAETAPKITTVVLPGNLTISLRLQTPIVLGKSSVGDEITALVENDLKSDRHLWLPKGSIAHGRIRRLEQYKGPPDYVLAGLEFSTIETAQTRYEFVAQLISTPGINQMMRHENAPQHVGNQTTVTETLDAPMVGVGYLYLNDPPFSLPAGFESIWRTQQVRESGHSAN